MREQGRAIFQNFKYCNKYYKLEVRSNVTRADRVHSDYDKNEVDGKIEFFVPRLQMQ